MRNTTDPLISLIQQFPIQALIAATCLLGFLAWLVAFEERLRRLVDQRRLKEMQMQLGKIRGDMRSLEVKQENLLVRYLNLPGSSSSSTVTPDEKNPSEDEEDVDERDVDEPDEEDEEDNEKEDEEEDGIVPATEMQSVPESHEIAPDEKTRPETNRKIRKIRSELTTIYDYGALAFFGWVVAFLIGLFLISIAAFVLFSH